MRNVERHIMGFVLGGVVLAGAVMLFGGDEPEPVVDPIVVELRQQNATLRALLEDTLTEEQVRDIVVDMLPEQRVVTVSGDMTDFLSALRHEADLLIEWPEKHTSKSSSLMINSASMTGYALSRVYNRLVNGCVYHLYNYGEDNEGKLKYNIRRIEDDCAD